MSFFIVIRQMKLSVGNCGKVNRNDSFYIHELCLVIYAPSVLNESIGLEVQVLIFFCINVSLL